MNQNNPHVERFYKKVEIHPESGCHVWKGYVHKHDRYGRFRCEGKIFLAHRWIYTEKVRPILITENVIHVPERCRTKQCVNPDHLQAVPKSEMGQYSPMGRRSACAQGHPFTPENTRKVKNRRVCLTCRRNSKNRSKENQAQI